MKLLHRPDPHAAEKAALADELGVDKVFYADEPLWYIRLTSRFRLTWRREVASVTAVFLAGLVLGLLLAHL